MRLIFVLLLLLLLIGCSGRVEEKSVTDPTRNTPLNEEVDEVKKVRQEATGKN